MHGEQRGSVNVAGVAGMVGVVLGSVGGIVGRIFTFPETGSTSAETVIFIQAHRQALLVAMVLSTVAATLWLVFRASMPHQLHA